MCEEVDHDSRNGNAIEVSEEGKQRILRRRRRIGEKMVRLSVDEQPLLQNLAAAGINVSSIEELISKFRVIPDTAVKCLLGALNACSEPANQEWILRALCKAEGPFDGREVVKCLSATMDETVRFVALNVIAISQPEYIDEWLQKARQDPALRETLQRLAE